MRYVGTVDGIASGGPNTSENYRQQAPTVETTVTGDATMLSDLKLRNLKAKPKPYKCTDRDGLYVVVSPAGGVAFRYDYRLNGRRETVTIGRYDANAAKEMPRELDALQYGMRVSLAEARLLLSRAQRAIGMGQSPAR
ncbi:MAG TPA: Arm DNA-binding domain-containing protein, partial [Acidiferrobacterales bacterium]|nr:Arm DNA-binding domain-containing protein [Acidiferrobacterales bacterium]